MKVLTAGIIIFICVCSYNNVVGAGLGEFCTEDGNCTETGQACAGNETCACFTNNDYSYDGSKCVKKLGRSCASSQECNDAAAVTCENQFCKCKTATYYDNNGENSEGGVCIAKHGFGATCTDPTSGAGDYQCSTANAICKADTGSSNPITYSCQCDDRSVQDGESCVTERSLGETCTEVSQCTASSNVQCTGSGPQTCNCQTGYFPENNNCLKRSLGETCTEVSQCIAQSNVQCTGSGPQTCNCQSGYFAENNSCLKRSLGETCTEVSQCIAQSNVQCTGNGPQTCKCQTGYFPENNSCLKVSLGQTCTETSQCEAQNAQCTGSGTKTCDCLVGYLQVNSNCLKRNLGETCTEVSQCLAQNVQCTGIGTKTCSCKTGYYQSNSSCQKRLLGQSCDATNQCSAASAVCSSGSSRKCQCPSTYYDTTGSAIGGSCIPKVSLGGTCPQPTTAVPNTATCSDTYARCTGSGSYSCQCISTYYDNTDNTDRKCVPKVELGYSCPRSNACKTTNSVCVGGYCVCDSQYYDDNRSTSYGGSCVPRRLLGASCNGNPPTNRDQCNDTSATCSWSSGSYKCTCSTGFHEEGSKCVANKPLGETCSVSSDCSDPAAGCLNRKCTCGHNFYDSNGFTQGGTCSPMTNLQVTDIDFPSSSVKTNEIKVTWSAPVNYKQFINRYTVEWKRTYDNSIAVQSENVASYSTSLTLTKGIESGRAYTVTIISINNQTQTNTDRSTSVTKQQAAKPSVTSGLDLPKSDQDATTSSTIKVVWIAAAGYVSQYHVQLLDGTTKIKNQTVSSPDTHAYFQSSGLRDGYRYYVKITARSESYDSGKRVSGETFTAEFKTTPQTPDPPQNGFCKDPTDKSITLNWSKPADTKGDLVKYHIYVYQNSNTPKFIVSTAGTETQKIVGNLDPGTSYTFRIYTENEMYNSSSSNNVTTGCKTKAKMSEAPTNLDISNVTSRSFDISWMKPSETHSAENYGYVLQIKDDQDKCVTEIIYKCSDCTGSFQISVWAGLCNVTVRQVIPKSKVQLEGQFTYPARLNPDISYTVTVTASNDAGRGYPANDTERTLEEGFHEDMIMSAALSKMVLSRKDCLITKKQLNLVCLPVDVPCLCMESEVPWMSLVCCTECLSTVPGGRSTNSVWAKVALS